MAQLVVLRDEGFERFAYGCLNPAKFQITLSGNSHSSGNFGSEVQPEIFEVLNRH